MLPLIRLSLLILYVFFFLSACANKKMDNSSSALIEAKQICSSSDSDNYGHFVKAEKTVFNFFSGFINSEKHKEYRDFTDHTLRMFSLHNEACIKHVLKIIDDDEYLRIVGRVQNIIYTWKSFVETSPDSDIRELAAKSGVAELNVSFVSIMKTVDDSWQQQNKDKERMSVIAQEAALSLMIERLGNTLLKAEILINNLSNENLALRNLIKSNKQKIAEIEFTLGGKVTSNKSLIENNSIRIEGNKVDTANLKNRMQNWNNSYNQRLEKQATDTSTVYKANKDSISETSRSLQKVSDDFCIYKLEEDISWHHRAAIFFNLVDEPTCESYEHIEREQVVFSPSMITKNTSVEK